MIKNLRVEVAETPSGNDLDELEQVTKIHTYAELFLDYVASGGPWGFFEWFEFMGEWYREDMM